MTAMTSVVLGYFFHRHSTEPSGMASLQSKLMAITEVNKLNMNINFNIQLV
jgi:hypothetical protein